MISPETSVPPGAWWSSTTQRWMIDTDEGPKVLDPQPEAPSATFFAEVDRLYPDGRAVFPPSVKILL